MSPRLHKTEVAYSFLEEQGKNLFGVWIQQMLDEIRVAYEIILKDVSGISYETGFNFCCPCE